MLCSILKWQHFNTGSNDPPAQDLLLACAFEDCGKNFNEKSKNNMKF